jgi:glucose/arabinose dehydrogenase
MMPRLRLVHAASIAALSALLAQCARALPAAPPPRAPAVKSTAVTTVAAKTRTPRAATATVAATQIPATRTPVASATPAPSVTPEFAPSPSASGATPKLTKFVDGLTNPTYLTHAGDGSGLIYVLEQPGRIRVIRAGVLLDKPFLDLEKGVGSSGNEQGLLGLAFAPDFKTSARFFVNYTDQAGDTIVAGFFAAPDHLSADAGSEWRVLKIDQPYGNHNGGDIKFGPDGMLYIGMGDGGSAGDPENRAQNPESMLGKMLRIDVAQSSAADPYAIPPGNPAFGEESLPELWSIGLRNPWRFSFDRATGALFIADVGQNKIEEINQQPRGRAGDNYGWKLREGTQSYSGENADYLIKPIAEYEHGDDGCSVTGGYVYRGALLAAMQGTYLYGDYCSGKIWQLRQNGARWDNRELFDTDHQITSFGEDEAGELYVLARDGAVYRFEGE